MSLARWLGTYGAKQPALNDFIACRIWVGTAPLGRVFRPASPVLPRGLVRPRGAPAPHPPVPRLCPFRSGPLFGAVPTVLWHCSPTSAAPHTIWSSAGLPSGGGSGDEGVALLPLVLGLRPSSGVPCGAALAVLGEPLGARMGSPSSHYHLTFILSNVGVPFVQCSAPSATQPGCDPKGFLPSMSTLRGCLPSRSARSRPLSLSVCARFHGGTWLGALSLCKFGCGPNSPCRSFIDGMTVNLSFKPQLQTVA